MNTLKTAKSALISVFHKENLEPIVRKLKKLGITIYTTGGTETFIKKLKIDVIPIEDLTLYPSILGGRVKTLHPKIFGGILNRRNNKEDKAQLEKFDIPEIDIVIVDLYPFEKEVTDGASKQNIIEKIDIGGISLIRAAAKNFKDVVCISSVKQYDRFLNLITKNKGATTLTERKSFAAESFALSSHYDTAIFNYMNEGEKNKHIFRQSFNKSKQLRYGENPHQKGFFYGNIESLFDQLNGKELSFNNLLDADAAINLISQFKKESPTFAILKHNNACGLAQRDTLEKAYLDSLAGDPISAFGGVLIANKEIDESSATKIKDLFCEIIIAPSYSEVALQILKKNKKRIILIQKEFEPQKMIYRTALNGALAQTPDHITDLKKGLKNVTDKIVSETEIEDLLFASKICKHTKSNAIILVKNKQLCGSGIGQTSRIDALKQAIIKAKKFNFNLQGAVMASDAFLPFPDCVKIAGDEGIKSVIQPGGSIKDKLSIDYCNKNNIGMVFTGIRHFKH